MKPCGGFLFSFGEERPVNSGSDSASLAENRRVEVRYVNY